MYISTGRRVAAFGYAAGYAGAAIAIIAYAHSLARYLHSNNDRSSMHANSSSTAPISSVHPYPNKKALVADLQARLAHAGTSMMRRTQRITMI